MADPKLTDEIAPQEADQANRLRSVTALKKMYEEAAENQQDARALAFRDRDWYDNVNESHWTTDEKQELKDRGQPPVTANDIKRNLNFLFGYEQQTRTDPRAYPTQPGEEKGKAADVVTDVLDFIENETRFDQISSRCFRELAIEGIEAAEVIVEGGENIVINRVPFQKFFYDPRSRENDFSDARWLGYVDWFDIDEAKETFPDKKDEIDGMTDTDGGDVVGDFEDKPSFWLDRGRDRIKIAVIYYRLGNGEWAYAYATEATMLREGISEYLDDKGKPCCPLIAQSCYVTRENQRFGVVRDMISPQREKNWRRSSALYAIQARRMWAVSEGVFDDPNKARKEIARKDGLLIANGQKDVEWGIIDSMGEASGLLRMADMAAADLDRLGPNRAMAGQTNGDSGRAIALQQNAGAIEENDVFDLHNDWKLRVYKAMWARAKQFWTEPKYVRVSDDEDAYRFIQVNQPVMGFDPYTGQQIVVGMENALAQMDVDIQIHAVQDALTLKHEQYEVLVQTLPTLINAPPQYTRLLIEMAPNLRDKERLVELIEQMEQQQAAQSQQQAQLMQTQMQMQMQRQQVELMKLQAEAQKTSAQTVETQVKTQGEALENQAREAVLGQQWNARVSFGM